MANEATEVQPPETFDPTKEAYAFNDPKHVPTVVPVPYSVREHLFDTTQSFLRVRNLAYMHYKIMSYQDTLNLRGPIKEAVLEYELKNGWLCDDRSNPVIAETLKQKQVEVSPETQVKETPTANAEVTMFNPSQIQPIVNHTQATPPAPIPPMATGPMAPPMATPPTIATPQMQAVGIPPAVPSQLVAPPPATPSTEGATGRKRRGVAVVPQGVEGVAVPPMAQGPAQFPAQQAPTFNAPPASWNPPAPAQMAASIAAAPMPAIPAAPVAANNGSSEAVLNAIKELKEANDRSNTELKNQVNGLKAELEDLRKYTGVILAAAHHLYMTNTTLAQSIPQGEARTAPEFLMYMSKFVGPR